MKKLSTSSKLKASNLPSIIATKSPIADTVKTTMQIYVFALMIRGYSKSLTNIAIYFGASICSLSRMLSHALLGVELSIAINRKSRAIIASYCRQHERITVEIIIDATIIERSSRKAENVGLYHSNGKKVWGHRITNVGLLLDGEIFIPLAAIPHHTAKFARMSGLSYLTEGMMVRRWLRNHMEGLVDFLKKSSIQAEDITFLLDAGYDNAKIQKSIRQYGSHFTMMVKSTRSIQGCQILKFFKKHRCLAWVSVYFNKLTHGKTKRLKYRIRTAENVHLSGVGLVNSVCSEKSNGGRRDKKTRRYLVSSRLELSGRDILNQYSKRWAIETWHKEMKQNYGLCDCSVSSFCSFENHIKLCLMAYLYHLQELKSFPSKGTTIEQYLQYEVRRSARRTLTFIRGSEKIKNEIGMYEEYIFSKVS